MNTCPITNAIPSVAVCAQRKMMAAPTETSTSSMTRIDDCIFAFVDGSCDHTTGIGGMCVSIGYCADQRGFVRREDEWILAQARIKCPDSGVAEDMKTLPFASLGIESCPCIKRRTH